MVFLLLLATVRGAVERSLFLLSIAGNGEAAERILLLRADLGELALLDLLCEFGVGLGVRCLASWRCRQPDAEGWLLGLWFDGGWICALVSSPARCAGPRPGEHGVRPRPMLLLGFVLWRLVSKPCAMVLPLALVLLSFFSSSGDGFGDDGGDHGAALVAYTEDLEDLVEISFFIGSFV